MALRLFHGCALLQTKNARFSLSHPKKSYQFCAAMNAGIQCHERKRGIDPMNDWLTTFNQYFNVLPADSPELLRETMALRYQVYCVEHGFENPENYPDGLESDQYDKHSKHSGLSHVASQQLAGTVRLILADPENPDQPFPMEEHCVILPEFRAIIASYPRHEIAEISRLAVSKAFRRRAREAETVHGVVEQTESEQRIEGERRVVPWIILGLIQAMITMGTESNIKLWLVVMEPPLLRLLGKHGLAFTSVGPRIDYHGWRSPCICKGGELLEGIKQKCPDVWDFITLHGKNVPG
jgi:N-acyl amino acid synthase of PEP-CTERM/exosortase system